MLRKEDFIMTEALREHGVYQRDIAKQLGMHPKTMNQALERERTPVRRRATGATRLDLTPTKRTWIAGLR